MKLCVIITLSREKGCLSTGHFGEWLQEGNLQQQINKKSENKQGFKKIVHCVLFTIIYYEAFCIAEPYPVA